MRLYWLPSYRYQRAFEFARQEYWTRVHVWPFALLIPRRQRPSVGGGE